MRTLADMTEEERAEHKGIWCEVTISKALFIYTADAQKDEEMAVVVNPRSQFRTTTQLHVLTPRYDLPRAWQADGTPPAGEWEHAERLSMGVTTVYLCGKENPTHRQWIGEWEEA